MFSVISRIEDLKNLRCFHRRFLLLRFKTYRHFSPHAAAKKSIQQDMCLPIDRIMLFSIREAAEYSNIGINKIDEILKQPNCPFVLFVGTKKLVKHKAFEAYIDGKVAI